MNKNLFPVANRKMKYYHRHEVELHPYTETWEEVSKKTLLLASLLWCVFFLVTVGGHTLFAPSLYTVRPHIRSFTWVVFLAAGITIAWVVLSRAVSRRTRTLLFFLWLICVISVLIWNSLVSDSVEGLALFCGIASFSFLLAAEVSHYVRVDEIGRMAMFSFLLPMAVAATALFADAVVVGSTRAKGMSAAALGAFLYTTVHMLSIWSYLHRNETVWLVENSYLFALFSPLTESIDSFGVFTQ